MGSLQAQLKTKRLAPLQEPDLSTGRVNKTTIPPALFGYEVIAAL